MYLPDSQATIVPDELAQLLADVLEATVFGNPDWARESAEEYERQYGKPISHAAIVARVAASAVRYSWEADRLEL